MVTVQQNERSYEEGERKGEREEATPSANIERATVKRDGGHHVKYISSRCIYRNGRKRRSLWISVKRK